MKNLKEKLVLSAFLITLAIGGLHLNKCVRSDEPFYTPSETQEEVNPDSLKVWEYNAKQYATQVNDVYAQVN